jgi:hypothetical protein
MLNTTTSISGHKDARDAQAFGFVLLLIGVTAAPIAFFLIFSRWIDRFSLAANVYQVLVFLAVAHVPLTLFFWIDRRYRGYVNQHPAVFYGVPALIVVIAASMPVLFGASGAVYLFLAYFAWLLWHYGRQNWGLLCLCAVATKSPSPGALERWLFRIAPIGGILGAMPELAQTKESALASVSGSLFALGIGITAVVAIGWLYLLAQQIHSRVHLGRMVISALLCLFFVPTFLNASYGVLAYATAHAAQYFVMMYTIAGDRKEGRWPVRMAALSVAAVIGYFLAMSMNDGGLWGDAVMITTAMGTGITMTHFFIDSRLWRLREPFQRQAIRQSFGFLFR